MASYDTEIIVRQRINERLHEAAQERLARTADRAARRPRPSWGSRLADAIARRVTGAAAA
jgi:hypothetical protein